MGNINKLKVGTTTVTGIPGIYAVYCNGEVYYVNRATLEASREELPEEWTNTSSLSYLYNMRDAYNSSRTNCLGRWLYEEIKFDLSIKDFKDFTFKFDNLGTDQTKFDSKSVNIIVKKKDGKSYLFMYGPVKKAASGFFAADVAYSVADGIDALVWTSTYTNVNNVILHIRPYTNDSISAYPIVLEGATSTSTEMHVHIAWGLTLAEYIKYNRMIGNRLSVTVEDYVLSEPAGFMQIRNAAYLSN